MLSLFFSFAEFLNMPLSRLTQPVKGAFLNSFQKISILLLPASRRRQEGAIYTKRSYNCLPAQIAVWVNTCSLKPLQQFPGAFLQGKFHFGSEHLHA